MADLECHGATEGGDWLRSAELYDPASGRWTATDRMNRPRNCHRATLLSSGKVLVAGGSGDADGNSDYNANASGDTYSYADTWAPPAEISAYTEASSGSGASPVGAAACRGTARPTKTRAFGW
jgi:hypothetical protein